MALDCHFCPASFRILAGRYNVRRKERDRHGYKHQ